jgi:hypothetical protein
MVFSSLRHIILVGLASLLMKPAVSQPAISSFVAHSAGQYSKSVAVVKRVPSSFVMDQSWFQVSKPTAMHPAFWMRADSYASSMAWTCRQELRLEKFLTLPLKIRLGSKEQVDWLEGKNQAPRQ